MAERVMTKRLDICDMCMREDECCSWRMADTEHERIGGHFAPTETGRGIHLVCRECSHAFAQTIRVLEPNEIEGSNPDR